jgi:geranylgeranyl diphosphate synthase, type II
MDISKYLSDTKSAVDDTLDRLLPAESQEPTTIHRAMRYSVFAGGKRLRPTLVLASGETLAGSRAALLHLGACIEMMHTYSLIHDDLPALDNDDLRRGRPTCHKVFGEAMAILTGDALLTRACQLLAEIPDTTDESRLAIVRELTAATGTIDGMIGGQVVDLESEGKPISAAGLEYIHRSKTGALLTACVRCGSIVAGASEAQLAALTEYGRRIGLAFQIVDDILDVTASSQELGKTAGKDAKVQKATYPALYGLDAARGKARELVASAAGCVLEFGPAAEPLLALADFVHARTA